MDDKEEVKKLMLVKLDAAKKMLELRQEILDVNRQLVKLGHAHLTVDVGRNW